MPRTTTARAQLIASATRLIHSSSYLAVSVDELCADAGVRKGSFYYFFPSKRELALAAIDEQWTWTRANILEPAFAPDVKPLERFERFFGLVAQHQQAAVVRGCPFGNLAAELGTQDVVIRDRIRQVFDGYSVYFERALRDASDAGLLSEDVVSRTADALVAYFQGALLLAKTRNDATLIEDLAVQALHLVTGDKP